MIARSADRHSPAGGKLKAALEWAARGIPVFPLQAGTKLPAVSDWTKTATTDPDLIRKAWIDPVVGIERDFNIGALASDFAVIDVDVKDGKPGRETLRELGFAIQTLSVRTPSGGLHLYYRPRHPVGQSPLGAGVDVRGANGYVVAPGSTIDGVPYVLEVDLPVAPCPDALAALLKNRRERARPTRDRQLVELDQPEAVEMAAHWLAREAEKAVEGENGDLQTYKVACRTRDFGLSEGVALDVMLEHWNERCEPPWDPEQLATKVANAFMYATRPAGAASPAALFDCVVHVPPPSKSTTPRGPEGLRVVSGPELAARELQPRPWLVRDLIPGQTVTLLTGDGGLGKSIVVQQLAVAVAAGQTWLGTDPERGGAIYVSCEDDLDEVHRRLDAITRAENMALADLADLHVVPLAGEDAVLAAPDRHSDVMTPTPRWRALVETIEAMRPRLLVLDNLADVFSGNEVVRSQARQFIGMLRGLAIRCELAIVVIGHPSLAGLSSRTGTSGSTAWSNSVRSRLYLERPAIDGEVRDPDLRVLTVKKANYAPVGTELRLRWRDGLFRLDGRNGGKRDPGAIDAAAEDVFLTILRRLAKQGRRASPKPCATYAPTLFGRQPEATGLSKADLERAMDRLLATGRLSIVETGAPSRRYQHVVESDV